MSQPLKRDVLNNGSGSVSQTKKYGVVFEKSNAVLQWLAYEERLLPLGGDGDQIKHAGNGGEKRVIDPVRNRRLRRPHCKRIA